MVAITSCQRSHPRARAGKYEDTFSAQNFHVRFCETLFTENPVWRWEQNHGRPASGTRRDAGTGVRTEKGGLFFRPCYGKIGV